MVVDKLWFIIPEIIVFAGAVVVSILGLSKSRVLRDATPLATSLVLLIAFIVTPFIYSESRINDAIAGGWLLLPYLGKYVKMIVCIIGIVLAMTSVGLIDRRLESAVAAGRMSFDPIRANRGEFYLFFLLSLTGVMLVTSASDLIWLFLALELTSLPTYIMVAMSRGRRIAQEAAVKYFFLGALSAAVFLYGFAMIYGATGSLKLTEIRDAFTAQTESGGVGIIGQIGMMIALLGIAFKIAAAPMHFYAADVYEGAAAPVTAFLGFVPKTAGFVAIILLLSTMGWNDPTTGGLPGKILTMLWMIAVLTMTLGNVGALLQRSAKRVLAYSSIAHSGYLLIGVIAGPTLGINGVLFYLLAYGLMNTAAFAVLAGLERQEQELESMDDLAGLRIRHPWMAWTMAISAASLLGIPPLLGFFGKFYLFAAGVQAQQVPLVVIAGLNSAISAWYYLRLINLPLLAEPKPQSESIVAFPSRWPRIAGIIGAAGVLLLWIPPLGNYLVNTMSHATDAYSQPAAMQAEAPDGDSANNITALR